MSQEFKKSEQPFEHLMRAFQEGEARQISQCMSPAVDLLETAILNRQITHPNHPVLTWNISNAVVEMDPAGARKISKGRSREKVDGLIGLCMALGLHSREPAPRELEFSGELVISA